MVVADEVARRSRALQCRRILAASKSSSSPTANSIYSGKTSRPPPENVSMSDYSVSPSPGPASPSVSQSSDDEGPPTYPAGEPEGAPAVSRQPSPTGSVIDFDTDDTVTCQWGDCGKVYSHLPTLIDHIHRGAYGCLRPLTLFNLSR